MDKTVFLSCRNSSSFLGMKLPLMEITQRALSSSSSVCVMVLMCDDVKGLGAMPVLTHISCILALSEVLLIGDELCEVKPIQKFLTMSAISGQCVYGTNAGPPLSSIKLTRGHSYGFSLFNLVRCPMSPPPSVRPNWKGRKRRPRMPFRGR